VQEAPRDLKISRKDCKRALISEINGNTPQVTDPYERSRRNFFENMARVPSRSAKKGRSSKSLLSETLESKDLIFSFIAEVADGGKLTLSAPTGR
jgi:hypothetical protein